MKRVWISALFVFASTPVHGGVLLSVENRSLDGSLPARVTSEIAIDGKRVRIDHKAPDRTSQGTVIYLGEPKQLIVVDHKGNTFRVLTPQSSRALSNEMDRRMEEARRQMEARLSQLPPQQRAVMEKMMRQHTTQASPRPKATAAPAVEIKDTGIRQTIKGYPTKKYEVWRQNRKIREMWVTDWKSAGVEREELRIFKEMNQFQQDLYASLNQDPGAGRNDEAFDEFRQVDGLPIQVTEYDGTTRTRETLLQAVKRRRFDDSFFAPPKGYEAKGLR